MAVRLIYPERRVVSNETIATWYADAIANNEIGPDYKGFEKHEIRKMAMALSDAGKITVGEWL